MTAQDFQKTVTRNNLFDKYFWYLLSFALIGLSIFLFSDLITNPYKYKIQHTYTFAFCAYFFMLLLGCYALYLLPNRYKVLIVESKSGIDSKKEIIHKVLDTFNIEYWNNEDTFYTFKYQRKWWKNDYDVFLGIDSENFYISVLVKTSYLRGGFIDFGGSEKLRNILVATIKSSL